MSVLPMFLEPTIIKLVSSNLDCMQYSRWTGNLRIWFLNGRCYDYSDVPLSIAQGLVNATSHGRYFAANIKNRFDYRRVS
jgi:hypothetical protein